MVEFSKRNISAQKYLSSDFRNLDFGKNYNKIIHKSELECVKRSRITFYAILKYQKNL